MPKSTLHTVNIHTLPVGSPARTGNATLSPQHRPQILNPSEPSQAAAAEPDPAPQRACASEWSYRAGAGLSGLGAKFVSVPLGMVVGIAAGVVVSAATSASSGGWIVAGMFGGMVACPLLTCVLARCCFAASGALEPPPAPSAAVSPTASLPGSPERQIPQSLA